MQQLNDGRINGDFEQLIIIASPRMLGLIRERLPRELERVVVNTIPKDLVGSDAVKLAEEIGW